MKQITYLLIVVLSTTLSCSLISCGNKQHQSEIEKLTADAQNGDANAQLQLGLAYVYGDSVKQDLDEAFKWLMKSAEQGNADAEAMVGKLYLNNSADKTDSIKAYGWVLKAAKHGSPIGQHLVGYSLLNGFCIAQNKQEAYKWLLRSAEQGYAEAQYDLGLCYLNGNGVEQNQEEAYKWFTKAAEQGNISAQIEIDNHERIKREQEKIERERKLTCKWKYETKTNAMTDQVGYTATLLSNESHEGARLELTIAYVNDGRPSMVAMCFNPVDLINFKTNDPNEIYTIKYRFNGGNVVSQECMMRNKYDMILEHSATAHGAQKYSGNWVKNLINSDKLAIEVETTRGNKIYTFDTQGLEWNHNYQK